jgi:hypothetical protein
MVACVHPFARTGIFFFVFRSRFGFGALSTLIPDPSPASGRREFYCFLEKLEYFVLNPLPLVGEGGELARRVRASGEIRHIFLCSSSERDFEFYKWFGAD